MSEQEVRISREFKLQALARMKTCRNITGLALELGVRRKFLYGWKKQFERGGAEALHERPGRPRGAVSKPKPAILKAPLDTPPPGSDLEKQVAELERLLGVKRLEVVFFNAPPSM